MKNIFGWLSEQHLRDNVSIKAFTADGKPIKLWKQNLLGKLTGIKSFITGRYVKELKCSNVITNLGVSTSASLLIAEGGVPAFIYVAVGTGTTAETASDIALGDELTGSGMARVAGSKSKMTTTLTDDTAVLTATFTATEAVTINETGIFNAPTGGTMLNRKVIGTVNLPANASIQFQHQFKMSPA